MLEFSIYLVWAVHFRLAWFRRLVFPKVEKMRRFARVWRFATFSSVFRADFFFNLVVLLWNTVRAILVCLLFMFCVVFCFIAARRCEPGGTQVMHFFFLLLFVEFC